MSLLKRHRMALGLTLEELAGRLKVSTATVSAWETGRYTPHPRMIPKLARLLGVSPMDLTRILSPGDEPIATN